MVDALARTAAERFRLPTAVTEIIVAAEAVVEHAAGVIGVIGGEGAGGLRDDVELCISDGGLDPI